MRWYEWLAVLFYVLGILGTCADAVYTAVGLGKGVAGEANKTTRKFIERYGLSDGLYLKTIILDLTIICALPLLMSFVFVNALGAPSWMYTLLGLSPLYKAWTQRNASMGWRRLLHARGF